MKNRSSGILRTAREHVVILAQVRRNDGQRNPMSPYLPDLRRVSQPFFAAALRFACHWLLPPIRPPLWAGSWFSAFPRPEPDFFPPPVILLTVAQARRSASSLETPR